MKALIFKNLICDFIKGFRMNFFAVKRDNYEYIHRTARVYQSSMGAKQYVFLYENTIRHGYHKFMTQNGKFIMKENSIAATGLTDITINHGIFNFSDYSEGQGWLELK